MAVHLRSSSLAFVIFATVTSRKVALRTPCGERAFACFAGNFVAYKRLHPQWHCLWAVKQILSQNYPFYFELPGRHFERSHALAKMARVTILTFCVDTPRTLSCSCA